MYVCIHIYIYIYAHTMEYYSTSKQNETMPIAATWMDLKVIILGEIIETKKDKSYMRLFICGI